MIEIYYQNFLDLEIYIFFELFNSLFFLFFNLSCGFFYDNDVTRYIGSLFGFELEILLELLFHN